MKSTIAALALFASTAFARPSTGVAKSHAKRFSIKDEDKSGLGQNAVNILNYALTLEHLEDAFYRGGLATFNEAAFVAAGFTSTMYQNLVEVAADEAAHVSFLTGAITSLGVPAAQECTYSFPYTDPQSFVALATILEGVGVSAYLGAAADITSPDYLTAAGSILTIEARHASYLRAQINESPFPAPYDTPLDYNQVYSLAAPFFVSCPAGNPVLPVKAFPRLAVSPAGALAPGAAITFTTPGTALLPDPSTNGTTVPLFATWIQPTGPVFAPVTVTDAGFTSTIPAGVLDGQSYVILSNCGDKISDDTTLAGPSIVEIVSP